TILGSKHTFTLDDGAGLATPDQGGATPTITPDEHKAVCNQYAVSFLRMYVRDGVPGASDFDRVFGPGGMSTTASSGNITIRWKLPDADPTYLALFDEATGAGPGNTTFGDAITTSGAMTATSSET